MYGNNKATGFLARTTILLSKIGWYVNVNDMYPKDVCFYPKSSAFQQRNKNIVQKVRFRLVPYDIGSASSFPVIYIYIYIYIYIVSKLFVISETLKLRNV